MTTTTTGTPQEAPMTITTPTGGCVAAQRLLDHLGANDKGTRQF